MKRFLSLLFILFFLISCEKNGQNLNPFDPLNPQEHNGPFESILTKEMFESFFPNRYGVGEWVTMNPNKEDVDFFSYDALLDALDEMQDLELLEEVKEHSGLIASKQTMKNVKTGKTLVVFESDNFKTAGDITSTKIVKYKEFGNKAGASLEDKKREIIAFLANAAQETTGAAINGAYQVHNEWGLYWRSEKDAGGGVVNQYVDQSNTNFPPVAGKNYYGRGALQLSWNYNYGNASNAIFMDKNVLLKDPDKVEQEGKIAWMTSIWFWMTPQAPKPSAHEALYPDYKSTDYEKTKHMDTWGFGKSIMIINGGIEGNQTECKDFNSCNDLVQAKVTGRIDFYRSFAKILDIPIGENGEQLDTKAMISY